MSLFIVLASTLYSSNKNSCFKSFCNSRLYDDAGKVILADKPYYVGITNDLDTRAAQHTTSGRLGDNSQMKPLETDINMGKLEAMNKLI